MNSLIDQIADQAGRDEPAPPFVITGNWVGSCPQCRRLVLTVHFFADSYGPISVVWDPRPDERPAFARLLGHDVTLSQGFAGPGGTLHHCCRRVDR